MLFRAICLSGLSATAAFMGVAPLQASKVQMSTVMSEATRDPDDGWDGIWGFERQKEIFLKWDPSSPRTYTNFNPFERNPDGAKCDANGCFPGESRGYQPPNRPDVNWAIMQEEKETMAEL